MRPMPNDGSITDGVNLRSEMNSSLAHICEWGCEQTIVFLLVTLELLNDVLANSVSLAINGHRGSWSSTQLLLKILSQANERHLCSNTKDETWTTASEASV